MKKIRKMQKIGKKTKIGKKSPLQQACKLGCFLKKKHLWFMRNKQNVIKSTLFCHTYIFFLFPEHFSFVLIYECNTCDLLVWSVLCVQYADSVE